MKITEISRSQELLEKCDWRNCLTIKINDEDAFQVCDGEPEDANLSRDFSDCWRIVKLMKMAYEAGKNAQ